MALLVDPPSRDSAGERPSAEVPAEASDETDAVPESPVITEPLLEPEPRGRAEERREVSQGKLSSLSPGSRSRRLPAAASRPSWASSSGSSRTAAWPVRCPP